MENSKAQAFYFQLMDRLETMDSEVRDILEVLPTEYGDKHWRLNNIYRIKDKEGHLVQFHLNWAQEILYAEQHTLNIILKARQLGCTTFIDLDFLDDCLFTPFLNTGIVAHTRDDASKIFREKVLLPFQNLPDEVRRLRHSTSESTQELVFNNSSVIRVGTSLRSATNQRLHVSEYGVTCAKYPEKAREIKTGALNTVAQGQKIWIESTAKGRGGHFHDLCKEAIALMEQIKVQERDYGLMDWKIFFFPWWQHPEYETDPQYVVIGPGEEEYFAGLADKHGITLTPGKKAWYVKKAQNQGEDMKQEYPSTPDEAFESSVEGSYFGKYVSKARQDGRICNVPYEPLAPVHTFWDLGFDDYTALWFVQFVGQEIHLIDYLEHSGEGLLYYSRRLEEKKAELEYLYGEHWGPHDLEQHELGSGSTRKDTAGKLGISFQVVPRTLLSDQIEAVRNIFYRCWFDQSKCKDGIGHLDNYRKQWNERFSCFTDQPVHDEHSHGASAFQCLACALPMGAGRSGRGMTESDADRLMIQFGRRG